MTGRREDGRGRREALVKGIAAATALAAAALAVAGYVTASAAAPEGGEPEAPSVEIRMASRVAPCRDSVYAAGAGEEGSNGVGSPELVVTGAAPGGSAAEARTATIGGGIVVLSGSEAISGEEWGIGSSEEVFSGDAAREAAKEAGTWR